MLIFFVFVLFCELEEPTTSPISLVTHHIMHFPFRNGDDDVLGRYPMQAGRQTTRACHKRDAKTRENASDAARQIWESAKHSLSIHRQPSAVVSFFSIGLRWVASRLTMGGTVATADGGNRGWSHLR